MRYYEQDEAGRRQHDITLREELRDNLNLFRHFHLPAFDELKLEVQTVEGMVCALASTLSEFEGAFIDPTMNQAIEGILTAVGNYKQVLYQDDIPDDHPPFTDLLGECIHDVRGVEGKVSNPEDERELYRLLFAIGDNQDVVNHTRDQERVCQLHALLEARLEVLYKTEVLDAYYVKKLVKGILESTSSSRLYAQMETVISWLTFRDE